MKTCPFCECECGDKARFCEGCGFRFPKAKAKPPPPPDDPPDDPPKDPPDDPSPKQSPKWWESGPCELD